MPERHLRGLLPEALLSAYLFWQRADLSIVGERRSGGAEAGDAADTLRISIDLSGDATVWRVPLAREEHGASRR